MPPAALALQVTLADMVAALDSGKRQVDELLAFLRCKIESEDRAALDLQTAIRVPLTQAAQPEGTSLHGAFHSLLNYTQQRRIDQMNFALAFEQQASSKRSREVVAPCLRGRWVESAGTASVKCAGFTAVDVPVPQVRLPLEKRHHELREACADIKLDASRAVKAAVAAEAKVRKLRQIAKQAERDLYPGGGGNGGSPGGRISPKGDAGVAWLPGPVPSSSAVALASAREKLRGGVITPAEFATIERSLLQTAEELKLALGSRGSVGGNGGRGPPPPPTTPPPPPPGGKLGERLTGVLAAASLAKAELVQCLAARDKSLEDAASLSGSVSLERFKQVPPNVKPFRRRRRGRKKHAAHGRRPTRNRTPARPPSPRSAADCSCPNGSRSSRSSGS